MRVNINRKHATIISVATDIVVGITTVACTIYSTKKAKEVTDAELKEIQARMVRDLPKEENK